MSEQSQHRPLLPEDAVLALFEACSNAGRWGPDDELGTLNHITPAKRLEAFTWARRGVVVSLGKDLVMHSLGGERPQAYHVMTYLSQTPISAQDLLVLMPHGFQMTHFDAVAHSYFDGRIYNGRRSAD